MDVNADLVANCISRFLFFFPIRWPEMRRQMRYNDSNTASDGKKKEIYRLRLEGLSYPHARARLPSPARDEPNDNLMMGRSS